MICIKRNRTDPYFNIAAEEYVLKTFQEDVFMLWQNDPCIVVGKHQNTWAEVNPEFVLKNNIPVIRRISGGGAVYHDLGNLNFTFVSSGISGSLVNFRKFTQPVIDVLDLLGVKAEFAGHNSLLINGRKFSGNAEHVFKNKVLHHGTMLFSSRLDHLKEALRNNRHFYQDKAVKSVPHDVTNISEHLKELPDVLTFKTRILEQMAKSFPNFRFVEFDEKDTDAIYKLVEKKYETYEWNFGQISKYVFHRKIDSPSGTVDITLEVEKGIISKAVMFGNSNLSTHLNELERMLTGTFHHPENIRQLLEDTGLHRQMGFGNADDLVRKLF